MTMLYEREGTLNDVLGVHLNAICNTVATIERLLAEMAEELATDHEDDDELRSLIFSTLDELAEIQLEVEEIDGEARKIETDALDVAGRLFTPDPSQFTYAERIRLAELASDLTR